MKVPTRNVDDVSEDILNCSLPGSYHVLSAQPVVLLYQFFCSRPFLRTCCTTNVADAPVCIRMCPDHVIIIVVQYHYTLPIYTTKIYGVVCPPNISETVAGKLMKLAHRPRIASAMMKLISKPMFLPILLILVKTIQRIVDDPKRKLSRHLIRPTPFPVSVTMPRVRAKCCRYLL